MTSIKIDHSKYVHGGYFLKEYGISASTLRRYAESGFIRHIRSAGNTRLYHIDDGPKIFFIRNTDNPNNISLKEKELTHIYRNDPTFVSMICYSRVRDESKNKKLAYEKALFERSVKGVKIIQEYGKRDNLDRIELKEVIRKCKNREIKYIFVTSFNSLAKDVFLLVQTLLEIYKVELYIVRDDETIVESPDSNEDISSIIRLMIMQKQRLLN